MQILPRLLLLIPLLTQLVLQFLDRIAYMAVSSRHVVCMIWLNLALDSTKSITLRVNTFWSWRLLLVNYIHRYFSLDWAFLPLRYVFNPEPRWHSCVPELFPLSVLIGPKVLHFEVVTT